MKTLKNVKCDVNVRTKIMLPNRLHDLLFGVDSTMCKQRKHRIMLKCQSNNASKTATGKRGYAMTQKIAFNVAKSRRVDIVGA